MTFTQKYPNLTWWFTCQYYVLHNGGNSITLYDQGREVWDSGEITDFDAVLDTAEMWIEMEYNDKTALIGFENEVFSERYPALTWWFVQPNLSIHNRGDILLNLYDGSNFVWDSGEMTDVDAIFEAAKMWVSENYRSPSVFGVLKTCCIALLLLCLSANINAQTYEFTTALPLDKLLLEEGNDTLAAFFPLMYKNESASYYDDKQFTGSFFDSKRYNREKWYYDKNLQKSLDYDYSNHYDFPDTVITYNPETLEEQIKIVTFCEWTYFIKHYGIRHTLNYNAKNQQINCRIAALAPILKRHSDGYNIDYNVMAWTALADTQRYENASLSDTALTWAKMAKIHFKTNEFERNNTDTDFVTALYNDIKQGKWQVYNANLRGEEALLSKIALDSILYKHPETINTLDTITRQYKDVPTGKKGFDIADCTHLRLHIIYFFDAKRFRLGCRIERITFLRSNKGSKDVVFWIKPK